MDRIGISRTGPGMTRRIGPMSRREAFEKVAVSAQPPRTVQKDERRPLSADLDLSLILPCQSRILRASTAVMPSPPPPLLN